MQGRPFEWPRTQQFSGMQRADKVGEQQLISYTEELVRQLDNIFDAGTPIIDVSELIGVNVSITAFGEHLKSDVQFIGIDNGFFSLVQNDTSNLILIYTNAVAHEYAHVIVSGVDKREKVRTAFNTEVVSLSDMRGHIRELMPRLKKLREEGKIAVRYDENKLLTRISTMNRAVDEIISDKKMEELFAMTIAKNYSDVKVPLRKINELEYRSLKVPDNERIERTLTP